MPLLSAPWLHPWLAVHLELRLLAGVTAPTFADFATRETARTRARRERIRRDGWFN